MCAVLLPPGGYPIAVSKYIIIYTQPFRKPAEYAYDETQSIPYDDICLAGGDCSDCNLASDAAYISTLIWTFRRNMLP